MSPAGLLVEAGGPAADAATVTSLFPLLLLLRQETRAPPASFMLRTWESLALDKAEDGMAKSVCPSWS